MSDKKIYSAIVEEQPFCMLCGKGFNLHIHHIRYGACGRHTYFGNVIRLCVDCHDKVHKNKRKWQPILITIANEHEIKMNRGVI